MLLSQLQVKDEDDITDRKSTSRLLPLAAMRIDMGQQKILVVDDDPDLRMGLEIRLRSNDYEVHLAENATCALQMARKHLPDLIILDLGLPDDDGYFVMRALQESEELVRIPVIVLSGWNRFSHELLTHLVGARKFFQKPVDDRRLLQEVRRLLV